MIITNNLIWIKFVFFPDKQSNSNPIPCLFSNMYSFRYPRLILEYYQICPDSYSSTSNIHLNHLDQAQAKLMWEHILPFHYFTQISAQGTKVKAKHTFFTFWTYSRISSKINMRPESKFIFFFPNMDIKFKIQRIFVSYL